MMLEALLGFFKPHQIIGFFGLLAIDIFLYLLPNILWKILSTKSYKYDEVPEGVKALFNLSWLLFTITLFIALFTSGDASSILFTVSIIFSSLGITYILEIYFVESSKIKKEKKEQALKDQEAKQIEASNDDKS